MEQTEKELLAVFVSFSGRGGVERMILNLCGGFVAHGFAVDLLLARAQSEHLENLPEGVRVVHLNARHTWTSLPALVRYLRHARPRALLAAKDRAIQVAVIARMLARAPVRLVGRLGTTVSAALEGQGRLRRWFWYSGMRLFYRGTDAIVAVSEGVAADVARITGLPPARLPVVRNPAWSPEIEHLAQAPVTHPWFAARGAPVILGVGRLTRQKDFPTLMRAFARVRAQRRCRLLILGEGRGRAELMGLARKLDIVADVSLPGFVSNPYACLARAQLFVLSSRWEGSPNVLTEALALGIPVVATDCPSGPREILRDGYYGKLVPMNDDVALARAIEETLDRPLPSARLKEAARPYTLAAATAGYLAVLGLTRD